MQLAASTSTKQMATPLTEAAQSKQRRRQLPLPQKLSPKALRKPAMMKMMPPSRSSLSDSQTGCVGTISCLFFEQGIERSKTQT